MIVAIVDKNLSSAYGQNIGQWNQQWITGFRLTAARTHLRRLDKVLAK